METMHRGGLTGKARTNRYRRRVERMHAQQLMDEYFGEDEDEIERRARHVPVRGRADFLPTLDSWSLEDETIDIDTAHQLELTLSRTDSLECEESEPAKLHPMDQEANGPDTVAGQAVKPIVIPAPYWARPKAVFQPQGGRGADGTFELRRFAYGCALGSAAAAAILLVVGLIFQ